MSNGLLVFCSRRHGLRLFSVLQHDQLGLRGEHLKVVLLAHQRPVLQRHLEARRQMQLGAKNVLEVPQVSRNHANLLFPFGNKYLVRDASHYQTRTKSDFLSFAARVL